MLFKSENSNGNGLRNTAILNLTLSSDEPVADYLMEERKEKHTTYQYSAPGLSYNISLFSYFIFN